MNEDNKTKTKLPEGKKIMITIDNNDAYHVNVEKGITGIDMLKAAQTLIDCVVVKNDPTQQTATEEVKEELEAE